MGYTDSLEYARETARKRKAHAVANKRIPTDKLQISFITLLHKTTMSYDVVMSTACARGLRFVNGNHIGFEDVNWEVIIRNWLCKTFNITQQGVYDEDGDLVNVKTFVETLSSSGNQYSFDMDKVVHSVIGQIRRHLREVTDIPHGKKDKLPLWYGNETTKEHDREVVDAYSGDGHRMVKLGGNFPTTLIKEPITFEKQFITHVNPDGEVVTLVQQDVVWKGKDGLERRYDHRLSGLEENTKLLNGPGTEAFDNFIVEAAKVSVKPRTRRPSTRSIKVEVEGYEFEL